MRSFIVFFLVLCFPVSIFADGPGRLETYYSNAVSSANGFVKRLVKDGKAEPWENLGVRSLIDMTYVLSMAAVDLPEGKRPRLEPTATLLELAEEMQDKNPESPTFGNFRWYWRTPEVTDRNAVEFVAAHALPVWFEAREKLPEQARAALERMLLRSVDGCLRHRVRSDYTNIAIYNFVHLILLGETFDRPDAVEEGERRLRSFLLNVYDHGAFEYNSPTYYAVDVDSLQLGFRYVKNEKARKAFQTLLEYFWTDLALNWYLPSLRHAGAQSRTYNYLYGVGGTTRLLEFAGLAPWNDKPRSADYLNTFHARYKPDSSILRLNERYPRLIEQRWGADAGRWMTSYILEDIALGTAGAAYKHARQNMVLTVDLADFDTMPEKPVKPLARNYFIADGREDPYGVNRYPTSTAGHEKALHMEAFWLGAQRTVDALGLALYTPMTLKDPVLTNVQSHFVFRKPDVILVDGKTIVPNELPTVVGDRPVFLRYGKRAFAIRTLWTRDKDGKSPEAFLIDDGNKHGVCRLTINHWGPAAQAVRASARKEKPLPLVAENQERNNDQKTAISYEGLDAAPGAAFWVRIGSKLDTDEKFAQWQKEFVEANVEKLDVRGDDISIRVAGVDGPVSVTGTNLSGNTASIGTVPGAPEGILTLDGKDLGRPILERIPELAEMIRKTSEIRPIPVDPKGTYWEAEAGFSLFADATETDENASGGKKVRINTEVFWDLDVKEPAEYRLWARVFAVDPESDSFRIGWSKRSSETPGLQTATNGDWHIGSGRTWRWIPLTLNNEKPTVPLKLEPGVWRLSLQPREPDGMVDRFFLTTDPKAKPE